MSQSQALQAVPVSADSSKAKQAEGITGIAVADPLLTVADLKTYFFTRNGTVKAVDGMSFAIARGETLAIVGESGCGKSMTALSLMRLIADPPGRIVGGAVTLEDVDLLKLPEDEMRAMRGRDISMIFQEPMTSLNPVMTIGKQIGEVLSMHTKMSRDQLQKKVVEMLALVRIPEPAQRAKEYPHQLSGGMRQRAMIAMALACSPKVLLADEPTTALDVTIQAQILRLILDLRRELGTAIVLITHDLGVIAEVADRVVVMYAGRKVEEATVGGLFAQPQHPYTVGLLGSVPKVNRGEPLRHKRLAEIPGMVPALDREIIGCRFAPRCRLATDLCRREDPPLEAKLPGHSAACWHAARAREAIDA
jgi:peptide/nickel transport system ATP-binding protein